MHVEDSQGFISKSPDITKATEVNSLGVDQKSFAETDVDAMDGSQNGGFETGGGGLTYRGTILSTSVVLLSFILILCVWDTWSTFTDIVTPLPENLFWRSLMNVALGVVAVFIVTRLKNDPQHSRLKALGNLLGGIGIWEFTEGIIETIFGNETVMKLFFYASCLILTYALIMYLERAHQLKVLDSPFLSPI